MMRLWLAMSGWTLSPEHISRLYQMGWVRIDGDYVSLAYKSMRPETFAAFVQGCEIEAAAILRTQGFGWSDQVYSA